MEGVSIRDCEKIKVHKSMFVIIYCYIGGAVCIYKYESLVNCTKELLFTVNFILIFIQC